MKSIKTALILILLLASGGALSAAIPASERQALIDFYNSTNGDGWIDKTGWKTAPLHTDGFALPGTEDAWYGVMTDSDNNASVSQLWLSSNNLTGTIPASLGNLINLLGLDLCSNYLTGSIPASLGNLSNLNNLDLSYNHLTGSIPASFGNLSHLNSLDLSSNQLTGSIPAELGNLSHLSSLDLSSNQLTGSIPAELGNMSYLEWLLLSSNQLTGSIPASLGAMSCLTGIDFSSNQLTGSIPAELANLISCLNNLYLSSNQLTGSIPAELGNLSNLYCLNLSSNQLTGSIPAELGNLSYLISLDLSSNQLSGSIPVELSNLSNLESLDLSSNQLSGSIPAEFGNLVRYLESLDLSSNQLSGSIPVELGNLIDLHSLDLTSNQLSGSIPEELGNLIQLESLDLHSNQLSGSIPTSLTNLIRLADTDIGYNALHTSDAGLITFLNSKDPDWAETQTIAPTEVSAVPSGAASITVSWTPITYTGNTGGYRVFVASASGGPYTFFAQTATKSDSSQLVTGLTPGSTYYFVVQTRTDAHTGDPMPGKNNNNTVDSENSAEVAAKTTPLIYLSTSNLHFGASTGAQHTSSQTFIITNTGMGILDWSLTDSALWLDCSPVSGTQNGLVTVSVDPSGLAAGTYTAMITVASTNAFNTPQTISVTLRVFAAGASAPPFGIFDSPAEGSGVSGSIPVTGWALDDIEVKKVEIKRDPDADDPVEAVGSDGLVYIGDAVFVKGARPDVESLYPDYPLNDRAGWGYMMLTYGLPRKGNGTFRIHAVAEDATGKRVKLGIKQITSDNALQVKPFGAIDTPGQGGPGAVVSGVSYINFGWALTPPPNMIPTDASTISVWIDSVNVGNPLYNQYRQDIADSFPECLNSGGAVGVMYVDTTKYTNGVHTIGWLVYDNAGNGDGIGSRFFEVQNAGGTSAETETMEHLRYIEDASGRLKAEVMGPREIEIEEMGRVEIVLRGEGGGRFVGWGAAPDKPLPIGSTLDKQTGVFSWMPAPGFLGRHVLHFAVTDGASMGKPVAVAVNIKPKKHRTALPRDKN